MKTIMAVALLACVPVAVAGTHYEYPKSQLAEFVVEKLDLTSVPSALRPKVAHGKKTLSDYGYSTLKVDDQEAVVQAPQSASQVAINVLEQTNSGIYVCMNTQGASADRFQRVLLLRAKTADGILKAREASKEFAACPVIGEADSPDAD